MEMRRSLDASIPSVAPGERYVVRCPLLLMICRYVRGVSLYRKVRFDGRANKTGGFCLLPTMRRLYKSSNARMTLIYLTSEINMIESRGDVPHGHLVGLRRKLGLDGFAESAGFVLCGLCKLRRKHHGCRELTVFCCRPAS